MGIQPKSYQTKDKVKYCLSALGVGLVLGLGILVGNEIAVVLGRNIPALNISADFAKGVLWAGALMVGLLFLPFKQEHKSTFILMWAGRIAITLGLMLVYEWKYGLDAYNYFRVALIGTTLHTSIFQAGGTFMMGWFSHLVVKWLPFVDSYHALKVLWAFSGMFAVFLFYLTYEEYTGRKDRRLLLLLGFFPSLIFWSSIYGKDPLTLLGISLVFYSSMGLLRRVRARYLLALSCGIVLLAIIRIWLVPIFVGPMALVILLRGRIHIMMKGALAVGLMAAVVNIYTNAPSFLQVTSKQELVESTNQVSRSWKRGGSAQEVGQIRSTADIIKFLPKGVFTALFRPLPGEVMNIFGLFSGLENLCLLILFIYAGFSIKSYHFKDPLVLMIFSTVLIWAAFYGFVCAQNLGTAVRFRLQIFPFLVILPYYILTQPHSSSEETDSSTESGESIV